MNTVLREDPRCNLIIYIELTFTRVRISIMGNGNYSSCMQDDHGNSENVKGVHECRVMCHVREANY